MEFEVGGELGRLLTVASFAIALVLLVAAILPRSRDGSRVALVRAATAVGWLPTTALLASRAVGLEFLFVWPAALLVGCIVLGALCLLRLAPGWAAALGIPVAALVAVVTFSGREAALYPAAAQSTARLALFATGCASVALCSTLLINAGRAHPRLARLPERSHGRGQQPL